MSTHRRLVAQYYRGRIHAHDRNRPEARADLEAVAKHPEAAPELKAAAELALDYVGRLRGYPIKDESLRLMVQQADVLAY